MPDGIRHQRVESVDQRARDDIETLTRMSSAAEDAVDRLRAELPELVADAVRKAMGAAVRDAIVLAAHDIGKDQNLVDSFWKAGSDRLFKHGEEKATKWLGARMVTAFGTALVALGVYLWMRVNKP